MSLSLHPWKDNAKKRKVIEEGNKGPGLERWSQKCRTGAGWNVHSTGSERSMFIHTLIKQKKK